MKVIELLKDAYIYGQILADEGEELQTAQISNGIRHLGDLISEINLDGEIIGYPTFEKMNLIALQEVYSLPGYVSITKMDYIYSNIRFPLEIMNVGEYFNTAGIITTASLPSQVLIQKKYNGLDIFFYFKPNLPYEIEVFGTKFLPIPPNADFSFPDACAPYFSYIKAALAQRLRTYRGMSENRAVSSHVAMLRGILRGVKTHDYSLRKSPMFSGGESALEKAGRAAVEATLSKGWRP